MAARRYSDEDVRRILALAAEAEAAAGAAADRPWTLGDVEQIAAEAGLAPQAVATAAMALERQPLAPQEGRYFGLPVAVSRTVPLSRNLSDDDWEQLVRQLRDTFAATGKTRVSGVRREWRVGNLRVTHEPAGTGALLELRTRKGDARVFLQIALVMLVTAMFTAAFALADGSGFASGDHDTRRLAIAGIMGIVSVLLLLVGVLRLPAWARVRARQFDALATFARRIAASS